ncbi:MAG: hypothetical protein V2J14_11365 [Erythrobacter sp.]|jgi:hypothetical protein|nr:hypothetical protein [Erythrobacter sp.]
MEGENSLGAVQDETAPVNREEEITAAHFVSRYSPRKGSKLSVCRASSVPKGTRIGSLSLVLGDRSLFRLAPADVCELTIVARTSDLSYALQTSLDNCEIAFEPQEGRVSRLQLAVDKASQLSLQKCMFRIGLWATGRGRFALRRDETLFVPNLGTPWYNVSPELEVIPDVPPKP